MSYKYARGPDQLTNQERQLLLKIDNGDYHQGMPQDMTAKRTLERMVARGFAKFVPDGPRFPAHYVITTKGSHALGTFSQSRLARIVARFRAL